MFAEERTGAEGGCGGGGSTGVYLDGNLVAILGGGEMVRGQEEFILVGSVNMLGADIWLYLDRITGNKCGDT